MGKAEATKKDKKSLFNLTAITGRLSLFVFLGMLRFLIFTVHVDSKKEEGKNL